MCRQSAQIGLELDKWIYNLQNIQDQLNTEFAKESTKYIFWFDDKAEYEDEVSELQLGDVKVRILDGTKSKQFCGKACNRK